MKITGKLSQQHEGEGRQSGAAARKRRDSREFTGILSQLLGTPEIVEKDLRNFVPQALRSSGSWFLRQTSPGAHFEKHQVQGVYARSPS